MSSGTPSTGDAIRAAAELGADLTAHRARPASDDLLRRADRIFAMDRTHVAELAERGFDAELLDPDGGEIDDPYGRGIEAYRTAYRAISAALDHRFGGGG
jgi:protein-tyrosine-phosphatase